MKLDITKKCIKNLIFTWCLLALSSYGGQLLYHSFYIIVHCYQFPWGVFTVWWV